ncbi:MAG: DUF4115 domain-containing protein [Sphingorhabdus sp.]|nr:DUF4115 domain-containing protein [Sphingorhabdus sp.]
MDDNDAPANSELATDAMGNDTLGVDSVSGQSLVGEQLKAARENLGMTLEEAAKETRIPMRHLEAIEKSEYSKLPGTTYAIGFTRSYAKAVEIEPAALISQLREEMVDGHQGSYQSPSQDYTPADAASVPSKTLAWTAAIIGILIVAGYFIWRSTAMVAADPGLVDQAETEISAPATTDATQNAASPAAAIDSNGQVVITAVDTVWVKIYDASDKRLFEAEMKAGESYNVPQDAAKPMIVTGRPDKLKITLAGKEMAPLGDGSRTIADVGVSAADFAARANAAAVSTPAPTTSPQTSVQR